MSKSHDRLKHMIREARLSSGSPHNAPSVMQATLRLYSDDIRSDDGLFTAVLAIALNPIVRAVLKLHDPDEGPGIAKAAQISLWPEDARPLIEQIGRESIFVPSRDGFIELVPDAMSVEEMREAGEYLISHGDDCIRRGKSLLRLAALMGDDPAEEAA